jgi:type III secretion system FlhB-like substrate exporter
MTRRLVGLRYQPGIGLPQVIVKASGELAEEALRQRAQLARAPAVVRNDALLEQLYKLPLEAQIGAELFRVVAVLLAHVLTVDAAMKEAPHA